MPETREQAADALAQLFAKLPLTTAKVVWTTTPFGLGVSSDVTQAADGKVVLELVTSFLTFEGGDTKGIATREDPKVHLETNLRWAGFPYGSITAELQVDFSKRRVDAEVTLDLPTNLTYNGPVAFW